MSKRKIALLCIGAFLLGVLIGIIQEIILQAIKYYERA